MKKDKKPTKSFGVCICGCSDCTKDHNCQPCKNCNGSGVVITKGASVVCIDCDGTGRIVLVK